MALDKLIDDLLLQQFLQKNAPRMAQEDLAKRLSEMEAALKKEGKTLADLSKETGQTEEQLRRNAVNGLLLEGYIKGRVKEADLKGYDADNKDFFDGVAVKASHIVLLESRRPPTENVKLPMTSCSRSVRKSYPRRSSSLMRRRSIPNRKRHPAAATWVSFHARAPSRNPSLKPPTPWKSINSATSSQPISACISSS